LAKVVTISDERAQRFDTVPAWGRYRESVDPYGLIITAAAVYYPAAFASKLIDRLVATAEHDGRRMGAVVA
jgi:hypothetical protein